MKPFQGTVTSSAGVAFVALVAIVSSRYGAFLPAPATGPAQILDKAYHASMAPAEGIFEPNERLHAAERLFDGQLQGSESVALASDGTLVLSPRNGSLYRARPGADGSYTIEAKPFAQIEGGRPLGTHLNAQGDLIVCTAGVGLQSVAMSSGKVTTLASRTSKVGNVPATPIKYANDLDIAPDGTIYFSDSSHIPPPFDEELRYYDTMTGYILTFCQGELSGRLLAYHPSNQKTTVVADGFLYSNGVAVSKDGDFVLVVETAATRIWKIWLEGDKLFHSCLLGHGGLDNDPVHLVQAGRREVILDALPGFPDGVSRSADGKSFWVGVVTPPSLMSKAMPYRWSRFLLAWVPKPLRRFTPQFGCILQISPEGQVLQMLMDPKGSHVASVASVLDLGDRLILGNLGGNYLSVLPMGKEGAAGNVGHQPHWSEL